MLENTWLGSIAAQWEITGQEENKNDDNNNNNNNNNNNVLKKAAVTLRKIRKIRFNNFGFLNFFFNFDFLTTSKPKPQPLSPMAQKVCFLTYLTVKILSKSMTSNSVTKFFQLLWLILTQKI